VYEELIPADERHQLGQYYTPPPIVELIAEICVRLPNDKVLDPGCGSGSFLVKAYYKLKELKKKENPLASDANLHKQLLGQLYGIDINQFPASLSAINLAVRNLKIRSDTISILVSDFFKINPSIPLFPKDGFDIVMTNPPYTRQEEMDYKQQIRDAALKYSDGSKIDIDARAGIYAYFFTHSAKFLRNGGRMGYITSNTWLDVGFGEALKKFFLDHFKIVAIIEFDAAVFGKALVNTCVSVMEKVDSDVESLHENLVKFVRLKKPVAIDEVIEDIQTAIQSYEDDRLKVTPIRQGDLDPEEKWGKYIRAPAVYFKIISNPRMTKLGKLADVKFGIKTGANEFFILDQEKARLWGITGKYLRPVVTSIRELNSIQLKLQDVKNRLLWVHGPKNEIKDENVLKYIQHGEQMEITTKRGTRVAALPVKGVHRLRTCNQRKIWYDLGEYALPPIIAPYMMWDRVIFASNEASAFAINTLHFVYPHDADHTEYLLGALNSTLASFLLELTGRSYGGGVLKVEAYELKKLPIIDPKKLSLEEKREVENALSRLCKAQQKGSAKDKAREREKLDETLFDALHLTKDERRQVYEGLDLLRKMRRQRKEVEMLVETAEAWKPARKKEKIVKEEPSKRLELRLKD